MDRQSYNYAGIREAILDLILHLALDDQYFATESSDAELKSHRAALVRRIEDLRKKQNNLLHLVEVMQDDDAAVDRYREVHENLKSAMVELKRFDDDAVDRKHRISPEQHLKRVEDVRSSIDASDEEVRYKSRSTIKKALNDIIKNMTMQDGRVEITLLGDSALIIIDRTGRRRSMFDLTKAGRMPKFRNADEEHAWREYLRRKDKAVAV